MTTSKMAIVSIATVILMTLAGFIFFTVADFNSNSLKLTHKTCVATGGIVVRNCDFIISSCLKPSDDAYKPCYSPKQCKNGCLISSLSSEPQLKSCRVDETIAWWGPSYLCPPTLKLEGQCAPIDIPSGKFSDLDFFSVMDYKLIEENKAVPIEPYACPT